MSQSSGATTSRGGIGFCSLLTIVFIVLKLTKVVAWSWFWVLSPMIFGAALTVLVLLVLFIIMIIANS
ncbi:MAG: hypothetical protein WC364_12100 [Eubacteriales bacterium]